MPLPCLLFVAALIACGDKDATGDTSATGDGGATDAGATDGAATDGGGSDGGASDGGGGDGGSDGGTADGGSDGGTADGGTTGGTTVTGAPDCLVFTVAPLADGTPCALCASGSEISLKAVAHNTCDYTLLVENRSSCLVTDWLLTDDSGGTETRSQDCTDKSDSWRLISMDLLTEEWVVGVVDDGDYSLEITFGDVDAHTARVEFAVTDID